MKLKNAQITVLAHTTNSGREESGVIIELRDVDASILFAQITLTAEQWIALMSRQAYVECETEVFNLEKVGKQLIHKSFEFCLEKNDLDVGANMKELAQNMIKEICPEGWTPDLYFGSQNSFFFKDDKWWARTTIRKWN